MSAGPVTDLRYIHLILDNHFLNGAITHFDAMVAHNRYILRATKPRYTIQKIAARDRVEVYAAADRELARLLTDDRHYDVLVLHSLYAVDLRLLPLIPRRIKIWCISWGFDLYGEHLIAIERFHEKTREILRDMGGSKRAGLFKKDDLRDLWDTLRYARRPLITLWDKLRERIALRRRPRAIVHEAFRRLDYFSPVIPDEYDLLAERDFCTARYLPFNYITHDLCAADTIDTAPVCDGDGIQIGNSATPENNHADIFEILARLPITGRRVIVPLSYGDPAYTRRILQLGADLFGDRFAPLLDFLPFDDYAARLRTCSHALFYHERQQALGNIVVALWNGAKVFLSPTSVLYAFLKKRGLILFSIPDDLNETALATTLDRDTVIANRAILSREYAATVRLARMRAAIEEITHR